MRILSEKSGMWTSVWPWRKGQRSNVMLWLDSPPLTSYLRSIQIYGLVLIVKEIYDILWKNDLKWPWNTTSRSRKNSETNLFEMCVPRPFQWCMFPKIFKHFPRNYITKWTIHVKLVPLYYIVHDTFCEACVHVIGHTRTQWKNHTQTVAILNCSNWAIFSLSSLHGQKLYTG